MRQAGAGAAAWLYSVAGLIVAGIGGYSILIRPALLPVGRRRGRGRRAGGFCRCQPLSLTFRTPERGYDPHPAPAQFAR
jgi:hypothetical protein